MEKQKLKWQWRKGFTKGESGGRGNTFTVLRRRRYRVCLATPPWRTIRVFFRRERERSYIERERPRYVLKLELVILFNLFMA
jgi:hypothetical protein